MPPKVTQPLERWGNLDDLINMDKETISGNASEIDINLIEVPNQHRKYFDEDKLNALATNIKDNGVFTPIIIRPYKSESGKYELISGERRLRAVKIVGLPTIPAIVKECDDKAAKNIQLWENLNREELNAWEETRAIMDILMSILDIEQNEVITLLNQITNAADGKITHNVMRSPQITLIQGFFAQTPITCESYRKNRLPLLSQPSDITEYLATGKIEYTKLMVIKRIDDAFFREEVLQKTYDEKLSLVQVKEIVAKFQVSASSKPTKEPTLIDRYESIKQRLRKIHKNMSPKSQKEINKIITQFENALAKIEDEASSKDEIENTTVLQ
jgi:ParB family transcriptional regulator, chromosome partitioning protein